jgi:hypothetical protein
MMVAIRAPYDAASARPTAAFPRMSIRRRQIINALNSAAVSIQATQDRGSGHLAVEAAGHQQDGHADDRRKQAEVGVFAAVVDERLDAHLPVGQVEVPMKQRSSLQIVEVVVGTARNGSTEPDHRSHINQSSGGAQLQYPRWPRW